MEELVDARIVRNVRSITARIYSDTCNKVRYSNEEISKEEMLRRKEAIDTEYLRLLVKLPSSTLDNILKIHKSGQLKRKQATLDAITGELLERELYGKG